MRVFFSLIAFSFMLATCQGSCFMEPFKNKLINGKEVRPTQCVDTYDKKVHPIGFKWNTKDCLKCECLKEGMSCCYRYGGIARKEGCKTVINKNKCKLEFYKLGDPLKQC